MAMNFFGAYHEERTSEYEDPAVDLVTMADWDFFIVKLQGRDVAFLRKGEDSQQMREWAHEFIAAASMLLQEDDEEWLAQGYREDNDEA